MGNGDWSLVLEQEASRPLLFLSLFLASFLTLTLSTLLSLDLRNGFRIEVVGLFISGHILGIGPRIIHDPLFVNLDDPSRDSIHKPAIV
jgi:hypothetical protein